MSADGIYRKLRVEASVGEDRDSLSRRGTALVINNRRSIAKELGDTEENSIAAS